MEKNVTKFYVTNWEGRVDLDPNMYDVTNFSLFFKSSLRLIRLIRVIRVIRVIKVIRVSIATIAAPSLSHL